MPCMRPLFLPACAAAFLLSPGSAAAQYESESVAAFLAADTNGDGSLDHDEFRVFIQTMAEVGAPMSRRIRTFGVYGMAFGRVDLNEDGLASPEELRAAEAVE